MGKAEDAIKFAQTVSKAAADLRVMAGIQTKKVYLLRKGLPVCTQCTWRIAAQADGTFLIK